MRSTTTTCVRQLPTRDPGGPPRAANPELAELIRAPWMLRVGSRPFLVRPSTVRDLPAVARMHADCSPRSLLDRYRSGGRAPAFAALENGLREPLSIVVAGADGSVVAHGVLPETARTTTSAPRSACSSATVGSAWASASN